MTFNSFGEYAFRKVEVNDTLAFGFHLHSKANNSPLISSM